jgi:hypothetical protein
VSLIDEATERARAMEEVYAETEPCADCRNDLGPDVEDTRPCDCDCHFMYETGKES